MFSRTLFGFGPAILPLFAPDGDPGNGGGSGGGQNPQIENPETRKAEIKAAVDAAVQVALSKNNGDQTATIEMLVKNLHASNKAKGEAENALNQLRGQVPDAATLQALEAYKALGTVEELKQRLNDGQTAIDERDTLKRNQVIAEAATLAGFKPDVLSDLSGAKAFTVELREQQDKDGKTVKVPVAKFQADGKDAEKPLSEYAESALAPYLPSLKAEEQNGNRTQWITQPSGNEGGKTFNEAKVKTELARQYKTSY